MLRWYLSPSPHFFSDWLWPYCGFWQTLKLVEIRFNEKSLEIDFAQKCKLTSFWLELLSSNVIYHVEKVLASQIILTSNNNL
jgi:hypothetical protein